MSALDVAFVGCALGLAISSKLTSLVTVPLFAIALGLKAWLLEGRGDGARAPGWGWLAGGLVLASACGVGGWFYLRNWLHFGEFIIINTDLPQAITWWEQPGFHTAAYYLGFGESLRHPFFAGFHSFWDGVYSTFWGDGLAAGMIHLSTRHPMWNYDFMTLAYWVALPSILLIPWGFARVLKDARDDADSRRRIALSLVVALVYTLSMALLLVTFHSPYYAQAKAFYILSVTAPLSVVAAMGLAEVPALLSGPRAALPRALYFGWLGMAAGVLMLSFLA